MKSYIKSFSESLNESLGKGSVILIKGKPDHEGKSKLYATHVDGYAQFGPNVTMLFLSHDFYQIKLDEGKLRALRIDYKNEDSLKRLLNLKSPGRISIVRNNNKTPLHWKTTKHQFIQNALREIESDILSSNYLLESNDENLNKIFYTLSKDCLRTLFFGEDKSIDILDIQVSSGIEKTINDSKGGSEEAEWDINFRILYLGSELESELEKEDFGNAFDFTIYFNSTFTVNIEHDPGDYWTPPSHDVDVDDFKTFISEIFIDGFNYPMDDELTKIFSEIHKVISELSDDQIVDLIKKKIQTPFYLK